MNQDHVQYLGVHTGLGGQIVGELWNIRVRMGKEVGWATVCVRQGQDREKVLEARRQEFCQKCDRRATGCQCG